MPRASEPHTPEIDLKARQSVAADGVLTPELAEFCQSGVSVIIGVCSPREAPLAGTGCGCRILPGGHMRLLLQRSANEPLLALVRRGGTIAATFSQPVTHRSIQVKGSQAVIVEATAEDRRQALRQLEGLRRELIEIYYSPAFSVAYCTVGETDVVAIDMRLDAAFVQTPGPRAGEELKP